VANIPRLPSKDRKSVSPADRRCLKIATDNAGVALKDVVAIGLDTPGPASAAAS